MYTGYADGSFKCDRGARLPPLAKMGLHQLQLRRRARGSCTASFQRQMTLALLFPRASSSKGLTAAPCRGPHKLMMRQQCFFSSSSSVKISPDAAAAAGGSRATSVVRRMFPPDDGALLPVVCCCVRQSFFFLSLSPLARSSRKGIAT